MNPRISDIIKQAQMNREDPNPAMILKVARMIQAEPGIRRKTIRNRLRLAPGEWEGARHVLAAGIKYQAKGQGWHPRSTLPQIIEALAKKTGRPRILCYDVVRKLRQMDQRPQMFALSLEAYEAQYLTLLDVLVTLHGFDPDIPTDRSPREVYKRLTSDPTGKQDNVPIWAREGNEQLSLWDIREYLRRTRQEVLR